MVSVSLEGVTKKYGETVALDRVSLEVESGSFFFLLGPSGCGKTTLLRSVAGLVTLDGGQIRFDEEVFRTCLTGETLQAKDALFDVETVLKTVGLITTT